MATILSLETTTTNCSVALANNGTLLALCEDKSGGYSHAEKLHLFIEQVLDEANCSLSEIDAIAVSKGPGSYTGLRIGVSAAKGLCFSLTIPLLSISTMKSLATQVSVSNEKPDYIIPMLDARRMEAYTAVYNNSLGEVEPTQANILNEHSFEAYLSEGKTIFIGNAVEKCQDIINHPNAIFIETLPSAHEMISLAEAKYQQNDVEDVAYFEPYYLKDFVVTQKKKK